MNERIYKSYEPKEDALSYVSAEDINELQRAVERLQENTFIQADDEFLDRCFVSLAHHPEANAMVVNQLDGSLKGITVTYRNAIHDSVTRSAGLAFGELNGYVTTEIPNDTGKSMRLPVLLVDQHLPEGSNISYEISYDDQDYYPVRANESMPLEVDTERSTLFLRINLSRSLKEAEPRVDAWAILYLDETYAFKFLDDGLDINIESMWDGTIVE